MLSVVNGVTIAGRAAFNIVYQITIYNFGKVGRVDKVRRGREQ